MLESTRFSATEMVDLGRVYRVGARRSEHVSPFLVHLIQLELKWLLH
jgi:hypothetical protein